MLYFRFVGDDDDDNEITDHKTRKITSSDDLGDYVSEQMTWTPSRADLCNFDATVSSFLSLLSLKDKLDQVGFRLTLCAAASSLIGS